MLRRSRRLSEAKEAAHYNGGSISKKKVKLNDNDVMNNSKEETVTNNSSIRVIILKYIPFDVEYIKICQGLDVWDWSTRILELDGKNLKGIADTDSTRVVADFQFGVVPLL